MVARIREEGLQRSHRVGGTGGHTNLDFVDTLPAEDLTKNATIVASFAYHAAMADTKVPRKPLRPQGGAR
jgi:hypothetical protein